MISLSKRKDNDHFGENLFRLCYLYNLLLDGLICQTWTLNLTFNITLKTVASSCFSEYVHMFVLIVNLGPVGPFATSMRRKLKKKTMHLPQKQSNAVSIIFTVLQKMKNNTWSVTGHSHGCTSELTVAISSSNGGVAVPIRWVGC